MTETKQKEQSNKVMQSMTYLPRRARVPHFANKFRHHLKIGWESCEAWYSPHASRCPHRIHRHPSINIKWVKI